MTLKEVCKLKAGDQVYWEDPDDGLCSKYITIESIATKGDIVYIAATDGMYLECLTRELS